ncbi:MAG TPA: sigma-70 family RNA polymerase sigma factor, partial [Longimicrobium sp.]|nr:sigma-70 family RNA polymerase sigma factor [Longimicrobium sp.]
MFQVLARDVSERLAQPGLKQMDDSQVVAAHLAGDRKAFGELVERYQNRLLNFVYRTTGDRERAEDLVQEAFLRVYRHLDRFDQSRKFSTWIYTIASNLA